MIKRMGDLILLRHGQTEWSKAGKHTGRTDVPLTTVGAASAASLAPMLAKWQIVAVFTSPASRAVWTAELANLEGAGGRYPVRQDPDLWDWVMGHAKATRPDWQAIIDDIRARHRL